LKEAKLALLNRKHRRDAVSNDAWKAEIFRVGTYPVVSEGVTVDFGAGTLNWSVRDGA
jgi:hypothetical protein